ncbi:MAG: hypothetical protein GX371_04240 [Bacteroidales bacterium]|nr:hypothetical protein [Bacteroidales bacterium]
MLAVRVGVFTIGAYTLQMVLVRSRLAVSVYVLSTGARTLAMGARALAVGARAPDDTD